MSNVAIITAVCVVIYIGALAYVFRSPDSTGR